MSSECFFLSLLFMFSFIFPHVNSLNFNYSSFNQSSASLIDMQGDASLRADRIQLTKDSLHSNITSSTGRAVYKEKVILWDEQTKELTDFTTHFSFIIKSVSNYSGDGLAFFIATTPTIPDASGGALLGLCSYTTNFTVPKNWFVAVEFDTYMNDWDPSANHVGIDVNGYISNAYVSWNSSMKDGRTANAWVTYNSTTKNLTVFLTYDKDPIFRGNSTLTHTIDLRDFFPSKAAMGFTAATGKAVELHEILSWSFSSKLEEKQEEPKNPEKPEKTDKGKVWLIVGLAASFGAILILVSWSWIIYKSSDKIYVKSYSCIRRLIAK